MTAIRSPRLWAVSFGLLAGAAAAWHLVAPAADHRDGPILVNTAANGQRDINDVYIFQAPGNPNNTVIILDAVPFPGNLTPTTFDPNVVFDLRIDNTGDSVEDITFRINFGAPDANGVQDVTVRGLPSSKFPPTGILAKGKTGQNIPITGGGLFRAAIHDDPFFFDAGGFSAFVAAGTVPFPRAVGTAKNFFGPNVNTQSMIFELPTSRIRSAPNNPNVGVYAVATVNGTQVDRMGRPAINTALIPPVPRNNAARGERRNAFNAGLPRNDRRDFRADMISVFTGAYGRTAADAAALTDFLLPDILTFDTSVAFNTDPAGPGGFPNGRRLRDDVIDIELNLITNGAITTDNVSDDNGDKITDGTKRPDGSFRPIAFPYIGAPNTPLNGPGTGPNP